jgi:RNA polymerase sigma-70 factor, ECF subfamily
MNNIAHLVSLAKTGDKAAEENLFAQFRGYLLLIASEEVGHELQGKFGASDFVQETMLIAHRKFQQFRGESAAELKGWLRQILRNDLNRVRKRFSRTMKRDLGREFPLNDAVVNPPDQQLTPHSSALIREETNLLELAMMQLSEKYRTAIRFREWEDLSYSEIAQRMGTTEEAARKWCARGMFKLEAVLKQMVDPSQTAKSQMENRKS